jgi:hypothetical protein
VFVDLGLTIPALEAGAGVAVLKLDEREHFACCADGINRRASQVGDEMQASSVYNVAIATRANAVSGHSETCSERIRYSARPLRRRSSAVRASAL